ncbi:MAG: GrpB family protein [Deltaproteobacteria bacterium]|nr:GrpB family protein [Deltaproteobacteria bacterium]
MSRLYNFPDFLLQEKEVIHEDSYEAVRFRIFRDRLCSDPDLLSAHTAGKKRIISAGVTDTDTDHYAEMKHAIIRQIL